MRLVNESKSLSRVDVGKHSLLLGLTQTFICRQNTPRLLLTLSEAKRILFYDY